MTAVARIVLAGGGPAAIEAVLALRDLLGDTVELELVAPDRDLVVRPYEVLSPFEEGRERRYPLASIAADLEFDLVRDGLAAVDPGSHSVTLRSGARRAYDKLIVAVGARQMDAVTGAIPFRGSRDATSLRSLLLDSHAGLHRSVAFVVPGGRTWPLPAYELALHTSSWLSERGARSAGPLVLVSPERTPLAEFGPRASDEVAGLLREYGVEFVSGHAVRHQDGRLLLAGGGDLGADLVVAISRLSGPAIRGLPADDEGFIPVGARGQVIGVEDVFAAGDATSFPVKQGGLATQQADLIAHTITSELRSGFEPERFVPVLRAVLFAGRERRYMLAELGDGLDQSSRISVEPLWTEPSKLVGRYLAPYLDQAGTGSGVG